MDNEFWKKQNCYLILKVSPSSNPSEIKQAYLSRCKEVHPDLGGSHEIQVLVNLAYEILSDPVQRIVHDRYWLSAQTYVSSTVNRSDRIRPSKQKNEDTVNRGSRKYSSIDSLQRRVSERIQHEKELIRSCREESIKEKCKIYSEKYKNALYYRKEFFFANICFLLISIVSSIFFKIDWTWIVTGITWLCYLLIGKSIRLGDAKVDYNDPNWQGVILKIASNEVDTFISNEQKKFDKYIELLSSIVFIIKLASTYDDNEEQIVKRITISLFLMGYQPKIYDSENRVLILSDGEEKILVRYRHRKGTVSNIAYVERMIYFMGVRGINKGILFCSPGLSENGETLAKNNNITWYSLERMNWWIRDVCDFGYSGPQGDVLHKLDELSIFLTEISTAIQPPKKQRYKHYWR